ncbi:16S rRNA (guanine(527)-N(7))-methyltransferase RsmG [Sediminitomix flava]|uniref:Ribosomal RNA small subunit methyltransferase G n=1 Tax=Sediminitomix flava TaxID=379075 RepID=A0A315ZEW8_SEDFL|nr:16S rRNA (guanine(527)-N(7))-methyltransferase RsmG [Sediminitomix flava]PWJ43699.1 16S rRNA m(7)G-527 methyltransferase [Sediminitomix flava]
MQIIEKYFPDITEDQANKFAQLEELYKEWNEKVNVISRKDVQNLYERHVLHSLSIAKFVTFNDGARVLDVGTGGGFPGIPLAILFPNTQFHCVDSIAKKIRVVNGVASELKLDNLLAEQCRAEKVKGEFDFAVTRAVATIDILHRWVQKKISKSQQHEVKNGLFCLKGGDLTEEFANFKKHYRFYDLKDIYEEEFFETKKVVYVPM